MKKNSKSSKDESKKLSKQKTPPIKKTDALRIADELQMDQVKLDVQNKELAQSQAEAKEIFRQYRDLYELAPVGYFILARDGTIRNANLAGANLLGVDHTNLINQHLEWFVSDESCPAFNDFLNKLLSSEGREAEEFAFLKNGNELLWVHLEATCFEGKEESRVVLVDISKQVRTEKALRESEKRYRAVVSKVPVVIFVTDEKGVFTLSEGMGLAKLGLQPGQVVGLSAFDLYSDYPSIVGALKSALAGHSQRIEVEVQGVVFDAHFSCVFDHNDKVVKVVGVSSDITERVKAQEALKQSEAQYHLLADRMTDTIWLMDLNLNFIYVSPSVEKIRGYTMAELQQISFEKLMTPDSFQLAAELFTVELPKVISDPTSSAVYTKEFEFYGRDGSLHSVESKMSIVRDEKGNPISILGQDRDITELKKNEQLLRESEQRYRTLAEASHDMIFVIDRDNKFDYVNSYISNQFEVQPSDLIGQPCSGWFETSDLNTMLKKLDEVFSTGNPSYSESEITFPHGVLSVSTWLIPLENQNGMVDNVLGVSRDIGDLKKLERSLRETNLQLESKVEKRTAELLDSRDQLRKLTQQLVVVQEEERRRISRELHDEAGQSLIGLRFSLDTIYRELPANLGDLRQRLGKSLALTDQAVERIRSLARGLRPSILDLTGINLGIKELCQEFSDQTGISVEYSGVDLEGLQDEVSISLYRFVQEALTNAAKHAQAGKVQVTLEYKDEIIKASVQDNGQGISNWDEDPGLGIVGIKERFDILGGWLEVRPVLPKGTQVKVCLPWKDTKP